MYYISYLRRVRIIFPGHTTYYMMLNKFGTAARSQGAWMVNHGTAFLCHETPASLGYFIAITWPLHGRYMIVTWPLRPAGPCLVGRGALS